jgi:hypothetical protein
MRDVGKAVYAALKALYGEAQTYHHFAEDGATLPYNVYRLQAAGPIEYHGEATVHGTTHTQPFEVHVLAADEATVFERLETIVDTFETGLDLETDFCVHVHTITPGDVYQEPEKNHDGDAIWHGVAIFEALVSRHVNELSSSSVSDSSSTTSSSTSAGLSSSSSSSTTTSTSSSSSSTTSSSSLGLSSSSSTTSSSSWSSSSSSSSVSSGP